ncbi:MAG: tol-pal system protein YbgF [Pseudomonadota bacterium]
MFRHALAALAIGGSLSVTLSPAAEAQAPVNRPLSTTELTNRVLALESSNLNAERLRQENARLRLDMRDLQGQLSASNGEVERLAFELAQAREELSALQQDNTAIAEQLTSINGRLEKLSSGLSHSTALSDPTLGATAKPTPGQMTLPADHPAITGVPQSSGGPVDLTPTPAAPEDATLTDASASPGSIQGSAPALVLPTEPQALFDFGKARLVDFDYVGAEAAFSAFLDAHDGHDRASEAQYWLGEVQYQLEDYRGSGATYTAMIRKYPEDPRAADALVKLARSMRLVGETEKACAALGAMDRRYPNASAVTRNLANLERTKAECNA